MKLFHWLKIRQIKIFICSSFYASSLQRKRVKKLNSKCRVTLYPPYAEDIRDLLLSYLEKESYTFEDFKTVWKEKTFSLIFDAKPDDVDHLIFVQELYSTCLGYLLYQHEQHLKVAIIYILYLLYNTQPYESKIKINVSIGNTFKNSKFRTL
jgi:hypothetical protein